MTNTWNRRRLILAALGALGAGMGLPKVALASVDRNLRLSSPKTAAAIEPLIRSGIPVAQLFVSESADVSAAISGLTPPTPTALPPCPPWCVVCAGSGSQARLVVGSLIINSEAEAQAFLAQMAAAIRAVAGKGT